MTAAAPTATLDGWVVAPFTGAGLTHDCYEKGSGPGVVLIPEIPGITPEVLGLAEHLVAAGFTVVVPSPFGEPGRPMTMTGRSTSAGSATPPRWPRGWPRPGSGPT